MQNEKRLIDANALMDAFRSYMAERCDRERCVSEENCNTCAGSCLWRKIVSAAPTVDAVEVVHARWKYYHKQNIAVCTNCSFERDLDANFGKAVSCPNCGAKMDGGNEDAER